MGTPRQRRRAQGLTEYVIVVGLVAILLIAAVRGLSGALGRAYGATSSAVGQVAESVASGGAAGGSGHEAPRRGPGEPEGEECKHGLALVHPETRVCANCGAIVPVEF